MSTFCKIYPTKGLPRWSGSVAKNPPANAGDTGDTVSIPGLGRSPGVGTDNPLQCSCLENSIDREAWRGTVHGVEKSQARLSTTYTHPTIKSNQIPMAWPLFFHKSQYKTAAYIIGTRKEPKWRKTLRKIEEYFFNTKEAFIIQQHISMEYFG